MNKILLLILCFIYSQISFAATIHKNDGIDFVVIQNQFTFNHKTIKSAMLDFDNKGSYRGLHIQLKKPAAKAFQQMIKDGNGKLAAIVFQKRVLSSSLMLGPLGDNLLLQVPRIEAEAFITSLKS